VFKNLVKNLSSFFEVYQNEGANQKEAREEYTNKILKPILEEMKKELTKFKGVKKVAIYSVTGVLVAKEQIDREAFSFDFEDLSSIISEIQKLNEKHSSNSAFSYILLDKFGLFVKKPQNRNFYLAILTGKSAPLGALISFLNRFEVK